MTPPLFDFAPVRSFFVQNQAPAALQCDTSRRGAGPRVISPFLRWAYLMRILTSLILGGCAFLGGAAVVWLGPNVAGWRFHVLDLAAMAEHDIAAETRSIDDQIEWLDDRHVLYGVRRPSSAVADVWVASIDGNEPARIFLPQAESPVVVR